MRILVTGAAGSIGSALCPLLEERGHEVYATDVEWLDVTNAALCEHLVGRIRPDLIYHLAGAKHAPEGEQHPAMVTAVNAIGTDNIVRAACGAKVILASTCKAGDPETAYGASKLIAERIVLNAGGVVVRFFNVRETAGNVFRLWEQIPFGHPIPHTNCWRYFIGLADALSLMVAARNYPQGRYAVDPGASRHMRDVAEQLYPGRTLYEIPARRGDRRREPLHAECEQAEFFAPGVMRIVGPHDPGLVERDAA